MDGYRKRYIAVSREDYDRAETILEKFYNRGDVDSITGYSERNARKQYIRCLKVRGHLKHGVLLFLSRKKHLIL